MIEHPMWTMRAVRVSIYLALLASTVLGCGAGWVAATMLERSKQDGADIETTIQQLRSQPKGFSGKRVRLAGQLDECFQWECSLCPESMTNQDGRAEQCLELEFRPLIAGTGIGSEEQERLFRFSSVVITATFDPACWQVPCVDRPSVLHDAVVTSVAKRRAGASGLWVNSPTKLTRMNEIAGAQIRSAAIRAGYPRTVPIRAFSTEGPAPKLVVCWTESFGEQGPGAWPTSLENALIAPSSLDFFHCHAVRKISDQFVVQAMT